MAIRIRLRITLRSFLFAITLLCIFPWNLVAAGASTAPCGTRFCFSTVRGLLAYFRFLPVDAGQQMSRYRSPQSGSVD